MRQRYYSALTSSLAILGLAAWSISPAAAGHGGGGHGGGGHGGGSHVGAAHGANWSGGNSHGGNWNGNNWHGNNWNGNNWHGNNWHGGWYGPWYGWGAWIGPGWYGWRGGNWGAGGYGGGYYDDYPAYSYNYYPGAPGYSSFYSGPDDSDAAGDEARIMIHVPPDAEVYFDGELTRGQGDVRRFVSPPLDPDGSYTYKIRAVWDENGRTIDRIRKIHVSAGQLNTIDFLAPGNRETRAGHNPNTDGNRKRDRDPTLPPPQPKPY